ncbi:MAG TPA: hypothetical protein VFN87_19605 [Solirubrobacteraceae bacterium]|nr:hypothetical protein [Solirubrobacteraceae bacterium]
MTTLAETGGQSPRSTRRLWLYGAGMLVPAAYFAWRYPLAGNTARLVDIGIMSNYRPAGFVTFVGGLGVLFVLYALALRESRRLPARQALPAVFAIAAGLGLLMALMYPVNAIDLFIYAVRSHLFTAHGVDPNAITPSTFRGDPWVPFAGGWVNAVSPYGPLWNLLAAPVTWLAGDRLGAALFGFKALALAAYLAGGWAVAGATRDRPAGTPSGALFYLWNPLVLWEGVGNGHNDLVVAFLLALSLLAWTRHRDDWVIPPLVLATLVKYVTALLLPLAVVALWRRVPAGPDRRRLVLLTLGVSVLAAIVALSPFFDVVAVWRSVRDQQNIILSSPLELALTLPALLNRFPAGAIERWGMGLGEAATLLALGVAALALWTRPARLAAACFEVLYVFLLLATWNFRPWYLIWLVAAAAVLPGRWPALRTALWTAGALGGYAVLIWLRAWWGNGHDLRLVAVAVGVIFAPTALATLAELGWRAVRVTRTTPVGVAGRTGAGASRRG